jgi:hypothetical protein
MNSSITRRTFLIGTGALLGGCASPPVPASDGAKLSDGEGLLALNIVSNGHEGNLSYMPVRGNEANAALAREFTSTTGRVPLQTEEKYYVLPMQAGSYQWSRLDVARGGFIEFFIYNRFTISPNTITYVGHLNLRVGGTKVKIAVMDHEQQMRDYLKASYPAYTASMTFNNSVNDARLRPY